MNSDSRSAFRIAGIVFLILMAVAALVAMQILVSSIPRPAKPPASDVETSR